jgi:hypothetical protein
MQGRRQAFYATDAKLFREREVWYPALISTQE